jgi:hypothetical protein
MSKFEEYLEAVRNAVEISEAKISDSTNFYAPSRSGALDNLLMETGDSDADEKRMISALKSFKRVTPDFLMSIKPKLKKAVLAKFDDEGRSEKEIKSMGQKIDKANDKFLARLIEEEISDMADGTNVFGMGYDFINYIGIKVAFENIEKQIPTTFGK